MAAATAGQTRRVRRAQAARDEMRRGGGRVRPRHRAVLARARAQPRAILQRARGGQKGGGAVNRQSIRKGWPSCPKAPEGIEGARGKRIEALFKNNGGVLFVVPHQWGRGISKKTFNQQQCSFTRPVVFKRRPALPRRRRRRRRRRRARRCRRPLRAPAARRSRRRSRRRRRPAFRGGRRARRCCCCRCGP